MIGRALVSLLALATAQTALAQTTNIVPDVAPGLSLGTTVGQNGNTYTIDGGTTSGTNLFHSFSDFDLGAGDIAQWVYSSGDPASIDNVVSRVTGGSPSSIMGILDSTAIPNADFYFINPAGIVFSGQDAQVNVPAAAHFSTASELRFANGQVFSVATPSGSTLSVAAPQSFGFLGNEGDILVSNIENIDETPFIANAGLVSFSAANITLDTAFIGADQQSFTAVGGGPLDVGLDGTTDGAAHGRIEMVGSWLQTWAADCYEACVGTEGFLSLNGGELNISLTGIVTDFDSSTDEGGTSFVRLIGNDQIAIVDSYLLADGYGTAAAGDVSIVSNGDISILDSIILAYTQGSGAGGTVEIAGANVSVSGGVIGSESYGSGNGGSVVIAADNQLSFANDAWILTTGYDSGAAGSIALTAAEISITDSLVASESYGSGDAGTVIVNAADGLTALNSLISSSTYADGKGGSVDVAVGGLLHLDASVISSNSFSFGDAGGVVVAAESVSMSGLSEISSAAHATDGGRSGTIAISTEKLSISGLSQISTTSANSNAAGRIEISADTLSVAGAGSQISSENVGDSGGAAGSVLIHSNAVSITDGARVSTNSLTGAAGDITFDMAPGSLLILSGEVLPGVIETSSGPGTGGVITIASPLAIISNGGVISALGESGGANVQIDANYFIASSDRENIVEVDGNLTFSNAIYDVSSGTTKADLTMIDASGVLQGQCSTVRATGQLSQLNIRPQGPYGSISLPSVRSLRNGRPVAGAVTLGACE